ncbi:MAG: NUDIX hydrolase [Proteobacteria bacterium]|nr:NUDIX hydrolase [Pseudomonadota bacterium]
MPHVKTQTIDFDRPLTTVDIVIFTVSEETLRVLLVRRPVGEGEPFPGRWALPGGFIDTAKDADLESCARRKLTEKTGVDVPYLEQLGSYGNAIRDPRGWSATHVYFALMGLDDVELAAGGNASELRWAPVHADITGEALAFDHAEILAAALTRLRSKVEYTSLPAFLMPVEFTLTELQRTYEVILGRELEKKAFRTRVLAADLLDTVPRMQVGANRPAQLYRLRDTRKAHVFARPFGSADAPNAAGMRR